MTPRKYLVLAFICVSGAIGDFCLKIGMSRIPPITMDNIFTVVAAVRQPLIIVGILFLLGFFAAYLTALSWADLTYVLPATAVGYIAIAGLSFAVLHEQITIWRWMGILLITVGVGFVTRGPAKTTPEAGGVPAGGMHP